MLFPPSAIIAWGLEGCMGACICLCGVSDMEWIMLLNYANCLWSPTVGNQFQCLCTTVPLLLYWRYMHTNESGNTTNRVHLNAHIGVCLQTLYSGLCMPITT